MALKIRLNQGISHGYSEDLPRNACIARAGLRARQADRPRPGMNEVRPLPLARDAPIAAPNRARDAGSMCSVMARAGESRKPDRPPAVLRNSGHSAGRVQRRCVRACGPQSRVALHMHMQCGFGFVISLRHVFSGRMRVVSGFGPGLHVAGLSPGEAVARRSS